MGHPIHLLYTHKSIRVFAKVNTNVSCQCCVPYGLILQAWPGALLACTTSQPGDLPASQPAGLPACQAGGLVSLHRDASIVVVAADLAVSPCKTPTRAKPTRYSNMVTRKIQTSWSVCVELLVVSGGNALSSKAVS